jgi:hypothetical protein
VSDARRITDSEGRRKAPLVVPAAEDEQQRDGTPARPWRRSSLTRLRTTPDRQHR